MATQSMETLRDYFKKGAIPTQAHFGDLLDSIYTLISGGDISMANSSEIRTINLIKNNLTLKVGINLCNVVIVLIFKNTALGATTDNVIYAYTNDSYNKGHYFCKDPSKTNIFGNEILNATQYDTLITVIGQLLSNGGLAKLNL